MQQRFYAFDSLRATLMFLGVVLHSAMSYTTLPVDSLWPFKDESTSSVFDVIILFLHSFRMPLFFVISGFFAALLFEKYRLARFCKNRMKRVVIPLIIFLPLLFPLTQAGFVFAKGFAGGNGLGEALAFLSSESAFHHFNLIHLWFLYYLAFYYVASILCSTLPERAKRYFSPLFYINHKRYWLAPPALLIVFAILSFTKFGYLATPHSFIPEMGVFILYALFYSFGWFLYKHQDLLPLMAKRPMTLFLFGVFAFALHLAAVITMISHLDTAFPVLKIFSALCCALAIWYIGIGLLGLCQRHFNSDKPYTQYLVGASYWVYIIHLPCTVWFSALFQELALHGVLKFLMVLTLTCLVSLVSYEIFVRRTPLREIIGLRALRVMR